MKQVDGINVNIPDNKPTFRWAFIVLPVVLLLLSLILTAIFYPQLPAQIAYHFQDSSPDKSFSRGAFIIWLLIPQVFFTLLSFIVIRVVLLSARYWPAENTPIKRILPVMGNMIALPQIILTFTMLDVFLYNAYQVKLVPIWVFALVIMILGVVVLGVFFFQTIRQSRRQHVKTHQE